jgi:hypothetical protein
VANLKLAQTFETSAESILAQFRSGEGEDVLVNNAVLLGKEDFQRLMDSEPVPFASEGDFLPTKASLYLRVSGVARTVHEIVGTRTIDCANFSSMTASTLFLLPSDDGTGGGSVASTHPSGSASEVSESAACSLTFPLIVADDDGYTFWLRCKSDAAAVSIDWLIDDQEVEQTRETVTAGDWVWFSVRMALPDRTAHNLTLRVRRGGITLDKLHVTKTGGVPTGEGPGYDPSPYCTVHTSLYTSGDVGPLSPLNAYDAKATCGGIDADGWHHFDVTDRAGESAEPEGSYAVVVRVAGGNDGHFVMWDVSDPTDGMSSFIWDGDVWSEDNYINYAVMLWSDRVRESGCGLKARAAEGFDVEVERFDPADSTHLNTKFDDSEYSPKYGRVVLDLPKKVCTFVMDQSGSMLWSDRENSRHEIVRRAVNKLEQNHPSEVGYNLITFGGVKPTPVLFASPTPLRDGDPVEITEEFFKANSPTFAGVRLIRNEQRFPTTEIDGKILKDGLFNRFRDTGLTPGKTYYYAVFAYDRHGHFSLGKRLAVKASDADAPTGISSFTARTLTGTGVAVDAHVTQAWHLDEGSGRYAFDFGHSNVMLTHTEEEPFWLTRDDVPMGRSGVRFDGASWMRSAPLPGRIPPTFTMMAWVNWYGGSMGTGTVIRRQDASGAETDFALLVEPTGQVVAVFPGGTLASTSLISSTNGIIWPSPTTSPPARRRFHRRRDRLHWQLRVHQHRDHDGVHHRRGR